MKVAHFVAVAAAAALAQSSSVEAAPQVNVTLYSESFCPDCIHFITGAWWAVWNTPGVGYGSKPGDGQGIIAWNQVVWGNARLAPDNSTIACQHGAQECTWNTMQACAIKHYPDAKQWLPYLHCLETKAEGGSITTAAAQKCAQAAGMAWAALDKCWTGDEGHALDIDSYYATAALSPAHSFVPWVTLTSQPGAGTFCTDSNCDTFLQAVCAAYTGTQPAACAGSAARAQHQQRKQKGLPGMTLRGKAAGCPADW